MYCSDTETLIKRTVAKEIPPCFPEHVYSACNGVETGISTVGFRSGRYAPNEAQNSLNNRYQQAHLDNEISQKMRQNNDAMMKETQALTEIDFKRTTNVLKERLTDVHFWQSELEREILDMIAENDKLQNRKLELQKALLALDQCILLCTDCLNARQRRFGEDLQQDAVELELIKELDMLNKSVALYKRSIEQVDNQLHRNREAKQNLEMTWSDKHEADVLDTEAAHLKPTDTNKQHYSGEARAWPQAAQSTIESWTQHAHDMILCAEHERMASEQLLQLTINIIHDIVRDTLQEKDLVNCAFHKRLDEYEADKLRLTHQLRDTCIEIDKMEQSVKELERAIVAKDAYLQTVQTRLHLHNQRTKVENCRDQPQLALYAELADLQVSIDRLREEMAISENNLKHLQDTQLMLEKEIHMKNTSIQVDKDHCVRHRMAFPDAVRLSGH